jgi:hypothetical protein
LRLWATANYCRAGIKSLRGTLAVSGIPVVDFDEMLILFFVVYWRKNSTPRYQRRMAERGVSLDTSLRPLGLFGEKTADFGQEGNLQLSKVLRGSSNYCFEKSRSKVFSRSLSLL